MALVGAGAIYLRITDVLSQFPYTYPWAAALGEQVARLGGGFLDSVLSSIPSLLIGHPQR